MKIGDKVRFLSEVGGGTVSGFQGKNIVLVEDGDGFEIPMQVRDVIVIAPTPSPSSEEERKEPPSESSRGETSATVSPPRGSQRGAWTLASVF